MIDIWNIDIKDWSLFQSLILIYLVDVKIHDYIELKEIEIYLNKKNRQKNHSSISLDWLILFYLLCCSFFWLIHIIKGKGPRIWKCSDIYLFVVVCSLKVDYPFLDKRYHKRLWFFRNSSFFYKKVVFFAYENFAITFLYDESIFATLHIY